MLGGAARHVTSDGPFRMETTYTWADTLDGGTRMTLRNRGEPEGFSRISGPVIAAAMRRANVKDLAKLKQISESASESSGCKPPLS